MTFSSENILLILSVLIFSSIIISKAGYRFGLPSLLLFLVAGMLFGVDGLGLQFDNVKQAQFIGMCSLCVILFSGGMETKISEIRPVLAPGLVLSTLGVVLTTVFTGLFIYVLSIWDYCPISLPFVTCLLLAATMSSTDSASVFNVLRTSKMRLKANLQPMLELESGSNDPMAFILTIILIQLANSLTGGAVSGGPDTWGVVSDAFTTLLLQFGVGVLGGVVFGYACVWFLRRIGLDNAPLYAILLLSVMFFSYTTTTYLSGNGYLAVYIAGIIIGNKSIPYKKDILSFFDGMTWLVQIIMFLILGLLVNPHEMMKTAPVALLIGLFMILVARPLSVYIGLAPFRKISAASKTFISWVGLRGAAPILFATYPVVENVEGAELIFNIVFFITLLSLVLQGSSITAAAKMLKLNDETPDEEVNTFGVEIPEEAGKLVEITLTEEALLHGKTLKEIRLPEGMLVMMIKRDGKFIVPNGTVELKAGDRLLIISDASNA